MDILGIANECIVEIEKRHLDGCGEPMGTIEGVEKLVEFMKKFEKENTK